MKLFISTLIAFVICFNQISSLGQKVNSSKMASPPVLERVDKRPTLGVDYSLVAKFKVVSRKTTYHIGEMIILDFALLNTSSERIFFNNLDDSRLQVSSRNSEKIDVILSAPVYKLVTPDSYVLLQPKEMLNKSYLLLAGCDEKSEVDWDENLSDVEVFEKDRFINIGQACIKISQPGEYKIIAKQSNQFVLVSESKDIKTAVGAIYSPELVITIIE